MMSPWFKLLPMNSWDLGLAQHSPVEVPRKTESPTVWRTSWQMKGGNCPSPMKKVVGGVISATSISAVIYCSHRAYGDFEIPMQHLGVCFECTNILCNVGARAELRHPLLLMWNLILTELLSWFFSHFSALGSAGAAEAQWHPDQPHHKASLCLR